MCWERKIDYVGESRNDEWLDTFYDVGVYLVQAKGVGFFFSLPEMIFPTSSGRTGTKKKVRARPHRWGLEDNKRIRSWCWKMFFYGGNLVQEKLVLDFRNNLGRIHQRSIVK